MLNRPGLLEDQDQERDGVRSLSLCVRFDPLVQQQRGIFLQLEESSCRHLRLRVSCKSFHCSQAVSFVVRLDHFSNLILNSNLKVNWALCFHSSWIMDLILSAFPLDYCQWIDLVPINSTSVVWNLYCVRASGSLSCLYWGWFFRLLQIWGRWLALLAPSCWCKCRVPQGVFGQQLSFLFGFLL